MLKKIKLLFVWGTKVEPKTLHPLPHHSSSRSIEGRRGE